MGGFNRISVVKASSNHDTVPSDSARKDGGRSAGREARDAGALEGEGRWECPRGNTRFIAGVKRRSLVWNSDLGEAGRARRTDDLANFISKIAFHEY